MERVPFAWIFKNFGYYAYTLKTITDRMKVFIYGYFCFVVFSAPSLSRFPQNGAYKTFAITVPAITVTTLIAAFW